MIVFVSYKRVLVWWFESLFEFRVFFLSHLYTLCKSNPSVLLLLCFVDMNQLDNQWVISSLVLDPPLTESMDCKTSWARTTCAPRYPAFMGLCALRSCLVERDKKIFFNYCPANLIKTNHFGCYNKYESVGRLSDKNQANVGLLRSKMFI